MRRVLSLRALADFACLALGLPPGIGDAARAAGAQLCLYLRLRASRS